MLAVSGGTDSTAMTLALNELKDDLGINLALFHLDHQIRDDSYKDSLFVQKLAQKINAPYFNEKFAVKEYAQKNKKSIQVAARDIRYKLLQETAKNIKAEKIATAHQANDQIETFFIRLLRGAALAGLKSIPVRRENIVRPLLNVSREEINSYLKEKKQIFLTDPSNIKPIYLRNQVRSDLVPVIEKLNPSFIPVLTKNITLINDEEEFLDSFTTAVASQLIKMENHVASIDLKEFKGLNVAIKRRLLRLAINNVKGNLLDIEQKHVELIINNLVFGFTLELPSGLVAYIDYVDIKIGNKEAFRPVNNIKQGLDLLEIATLPAKEAKSRHSNLSSKLVVSLDYDKIIPPLMVRGRQDGDSFKPLGLKGTKKLQDFFVDNKVPKHSRNSVIIVTDQEKIVWVAGHQIDDRAKIDKNTKTILQLSLR